MKKPAALPSVVCSSPAVVDWSVVPSGREMTTSGAFFLVVSTGLLLLRGATWKRVFGLWGRFLGFLAIFEKCKAFYWSQLCTHSEGNSMPVVLNKPGKGKRKHSLVQTCWILWLFHLSRLRSMFVPEDFLFSSWTHFFRKPWWPVGLKEWPLAIPLLSEQLKCTQSSFFTIYLMPL